MKAIAIFFGALASSAVFAQPDNHATESKRTAKMYAAREAKESDERRKNELARMSRLSDSSKTSPETQASLKCLLNQSAIRTTEKEASRKPTLEQRLTILEHKLAYLEAGCKDRLKEKR